MPVHDRRPIPADAVEILTNPDFYQSQPAVLASAWARAKAARGQIVNLHRLAPAYLLGQPQVEAQSVPCAATQMDTTPRAVIIARRLGLPEAPVPAFRPNATLDPYRRMAGVCAPRADFLAPAQSDKGGAA